MWRASVLTLYPEMFPGPLGQSLVGRALEDNRWALETVDIRDFASGKHRNVDDTPAGGGAGMVMRADVVAASIDAILEEEDPRPRLFLSPRGKPLEQEFVRELADGPGAILLCGRFEGIDQRVIEARNFREISLGDFVLNGGEIASMALLEAIVRLLPGVIGKEASHQQESFADHLLEYSHYTRPRDWEGHDIPDVLLSGDHGAIEKWRQEEAEKLTRALRPDLWQKHQKAKGT